MRITQESFEDFLKCPRNSHLVSEGAVGPESEIQDWQRRLQEDYKEAASAHLRSSLEANEWYVGTPPLARLKERLYRLILDYAVAEPEVHARLQGLESDRSRSRPRIHSYIPFRFMPKEKVTAFDRLLLAFDAFALSRTTGKLSSVGKIVHGCRYSPTKVALARLHRKVRSVIEKMMTEQAKSAAPPVVLNRHCTECQFQSQCRGIAREKDDLSLLATIRDVECKRFHERGIFTATQLSYAFRPRRHSTTVFTKHFPALKALAVREGRIHILGTPTLNCLGTPVYLDVEGDADWKPSRERPVLFWADDTVEEGKIWADFGKARAGREATVQDVLRTLRGVLVSDFYAAYDSLGARSRSA